MSEQNHAKGRGRGRGKDLTSSERVAQWVNQREIRRLNKQRWLNRGQASTLSEEKHENSKEISHEMQCGDEVNGNKKSRPKQTPQTQIYVPPFLRQKKAQTQCLNDNLDSSSIVSNLPQPTDCSKKVSDGEETKAPPLNHCSCDKVESKSRGRGRKRPEVAVYVPRALREAQRQNKESSKEIGNLKSNAVGQNVTNGSSCSQGCYESKTYPNQSSTHKVPPSDVNLTHALGDTSAKNREDSFCSEVSSPSPREEKEPNTTKAESAQLLEDDTRLCQQSVHSGDLTSTPNSTYTFEFYDPAVVAFMPSSVVPQGLNKNFNNSVVDQDHYFNLTKANESSHDSISDQDYNVRVESAHTVSSGSQAATSKSLTLLNAQFPFSSQIITSTPLSSSTCEPVVSTKQTFVNGELSFTPRAAVKETFDPNSQNPILAPTYQCNENMDGDTDKTKTDGATVEDEPEDSWDTMFDDNGDCLDESLMDELVQTVGKVEITKPKINYLKYEPKEPDVDMKALGHVVEIYDFSPDLATCDLISAFRDFASRGFDVKWVDDTHALGVFSNAVAADEALQMMHPLLKIRPMSQASKQSQSKARHCQEFLQPYKARPETTSIAARRLVAGALGMAPRVSREERDRERQKLKEAKEKRRQEKQQKIDIWDGSFGKCAMDDVQS